MAQLRSWIARAVVLVLLLAVELVALTPPFATYSTVEQANAWGWFWVKVLHQIRPALFTGVLCVLFLSWRVVLDEFRHAMELSARRRYRWAPWLLVHLLLVGALVISKVLGTTNPSASLGEDRFSLSIWAVMSVPVFATWAAALLPARFWTGWFTRSRSAFLVGAGVGAVADLLAGSTERLWWPLQRLTFQLVVPLLRLTGQTVIDDPQHFTIGTPRFSVQIWAQCSGFEGIGLVAVFLGIYLWYFRRELRFPQAFLLFPIGAIAIFATNAIRITALILIGGWSPEVGFKGFHSVAGWLFFNLVACGLIWTSWRYNLFAKPDALARNKSAANPAAVYLVPLVTIIAVSMVSRVFEGRFELYYPVRVVAALVAFWLYRRELAEMRWNFSYAASALGVVVFLIWIALVKSDSSTTVAVGNALVGLSAVDAAGWLLFRVVGSVIVAPLAEELAFRGYLIRKLVADDFRSVSPGRFTWISFLGSSILFGALHGEWLAGTIAGMIFALALYRRGSLGDSVLAHGTANALLSAYILATGNWSLWA